MKLTAEEIKDIVGRIEKAMLEADDLSFETRSGVREGVGEDFMFKKFELDGRRTFIIHINGGSDGSGNLL